MSSAAKKILQEILQLPLDDQVAIAEEVLSNYEAESLEEIDEAWKVEVRRRIAEIRSGEVKTFPWEEARAKLWARANGKT